MSSNKKVIYIKNNYFLYKGSYISVLLVANEMSVSFMLLVKGWKQNDKQKIWNLSWTSIPEKDWEIQNPHY